MQKIKITHVFPYGNTKYIFHIRHERVNTGEPFGVVPQLLGFFPFFTVFFLSCVRCSWDSRGSILGLTSPTHFIKLPFILTFTKVFYQTLAIFFILTIQTYVNTSVRYFVIRNFRSQILVWCGCLKYNCYHFFVQITWPHACTNLHVDSYNF